MSDISDILISLAADAEQSIDDLIFRIRKRLRLTEPLQIIPYRSYGTVNRLYIKGRVLEDKGLVKASDKDTILNNLIQMYQRFESDEVPGAKLKLSFQGKHYTVITDKEGYFIINITPVNPLEWQAMWHEIELELIEAPLPFSKGLKAVAHVLVPPPDAEYGVISDIDDTVIQTGATDFLAMSRNTFLHNARTRLPFAGVSEFYKALQSGRNGKQNNPFFYVSSSPWNLYDLLTDFLDLNNIPPGPLLLRDFGLNNLKTGSGHMQHKMKEIEQILTAYPHLNFVLVGDSGQEDPAIYLEAVKKFPDRILAVYIRDVQIPEKELAARRISEELAGYNVEMVIVDNTVEAAAHAAKIGLIYTASITEIEEDKMQDKGERPGRKELNNQT